MPRKKKFEVTIVTPCLLPSHGGVNMPGDKFTVTRLDPEIKWATGSGLARVEEVSPPPKTPKAKATTKAKAASSKTKSQGSKPK